MLTRMAKESGIDTPSAEDLARFDRKRKGQDACRTPTGTARPTVTPGIAKMKDGTTHLAYKPEHAVDLDTGARRGRADHIRPTKAIRRRFRRRRWAPPRATSTRLGLAPSEEEPCVVVADKGYHSREQLKALEGGVWKTRIARTRAVQGLPALAWRRGGAQSGLRQSRAG